MRGFVTTADDGEALPGVNVTLVDERGSVHGMASNRDGFFLIARLQPGQYQLQASFVGFKTFRDTLTLDAGHQLIANIGMESGPVRMEEVAVEAEGEGGGARLTAGLQTVDSRDLELIPTPDVSGDLVSYLTSIPGVVQMGDRGGQLFIRGGEPTQNMTLLDGIDVFQPFHILGFYSAFPEEIIGQADIYAGGFPARFIDRISSVIDVRTRNGNKRAYNASASLSSFTSAGHVEGPIVKGKASFLGSGRVSTLESIATRYVDDPLPYEFSDLFGKIHAVTGKNTQLSVTGLYTSDTGTLSSEDDFFQRNDVIRWQNTAIGGRYLVAPRSLSVLAEILVSYSRLQSEFGPAASPTRTADVQMVNTALNMTYFSGLSEIAWGFFFRAPTTGAELDGLYQNIVERRFVTTHAGGYIDSEIYFGGGLRARPGVSAQIYGVSSASLEPRLRLSWDRGPHHWSGAIGVYRQHFTGLSDRRDATSIFTAWVETPRNEPTSALHLIGGYRVQLAPAIEASAELFHKKLSNLFVTEWTAFPSFTTRVRTASGGVRGIDARLEWSRSRFYGYLNYGYSSTTYEIEPEKPGEIDYGEYRPPHDRRHQVNVLVALRLLGFDLSTRWQFGSGLPYTPVKGFDGFILMDGAVDVRQIRGFPRVIYESVPYRETLPTYHRLDVTIERSFDLFRGAEMTVMAGMLNVYDRHNLLALDLLTAQRSNQLPVVTVGGLRLRF